MMSENLLNDESYRVTRQSGTERPYTGKYWDFKGQENYKCICCGQELFQSILNLIQVVVGQVFSCLKMKILLMNLRTIHLV